MSGDGHPPLRVLLVEDEVLLAMMIEHMIEELGARVWATAASVAQALTLLAKSQPDAAVLDINLGEERVFPVCERLAELEVPFVFSTGYGAAGVPSEWQARPILQKPYGKEALGAALGRVAGPA